MSHAHVRQIEICAAIVTVSTTRTTETATSGKAIEAIFRENNIPVTCYSIVPDKIETIRDAWFLAMKQANCIIFHGGTGLTHDDCTIEAISPLLEKRIDGFGEFFRMRSIQQIGMAAMLSRAVAGTSQGKAIFCIPGSTPAVTLAMTELIIPEITHILSHANL
jgi:molybdopterin adenylyltransferase